MAFDVANAGRSMASPGNLPAQPAETQHCRTKTKLNVFMRQRYSWR